MAQGSKKAHWVNPWKFLICHLKYNQVHKCLEFFLTVESKPWYIYHHKFESLLSPLPQKCSSVFTSSLRFISSVVTVYSISFHQAQFIYSKIHIYIHFLEFYNYRTLYSVIIITTNKTSQIVHPESQNKPSPKWIQIQMISGVLSMALFDP